MEKLYAIYEDKMSPEVFNKCRMEIIQYLQKTKYFSVSDNILKTKSTAKTIKNNPISEILNQTDMDWIEQSIFTNRMYSNMCEEFLCNHIESYSDKCRMEDCIDDHFEEVFNNVMDEYREKLNETDDPIDLITEITEVIMNDVDYQVVDTKLIQNKILNRLFNK